MSQRRRVPAWRRSFRTTGGVAAVAAMMLTGCTSEASPGSASNQGAGLDAAARDAPMVRTDKGPVQGTKAGSTRSFVGIPFAAPPVGELRWQPPRPAEKWDEPRTPPEKPKACPQEGTELGQPSTNEDCLYLNVTTPSNASGERLPVMVWLHGGSFKDGAGHLYGAQRMANEGNVAVVTVNYRLGAFGFLSHPALDKGPGAGMSGNYGLQDQQAALRWVQRNIEAFGGDADNVTLAGESGGAAAVCSHLAAPRSAGLFHRAIMQSNPCMNDHSEYHSAVPRSRSVAAEQGRKIATALGCDVDGSSTADCLRDRDVAQIRDASGEGDGLGPVYGTDTLPTQPKATVENGHVHGVPVMHGINRDEERFMLLGSHPEPVPPEQYRREIENRFGQNAGAVLDTYPCADTDDCRVTLAAVQTDANFAYPMTTTSAALSEKAPVYAYEYADPNAPAMKGVPDSGYPLGAYHTAELPSLFGTSWFAELEPAQQELSRQMIGYWSRFARDGDPNAGGAPDWRPTSAGDRFVLQLAPGEGGIEPTDFRQRHNIEFWRSLTG